MRSQALDVQSALHRTSKLLDADMALCSTPTERAKLAAALASVAKGWQSVTDQLRILSGKPGPGTLSPSERARQREQQQAAKPRARDWPRPIPRASAGSG